MRKTALVFLKVNQAFLLAFFGVFIFSCGHFRSTAAFPLKKEEVNIHFITQYQNTESVVNRVYVYPPLKVSKNGVPTEKLFHKFDQKGDLIWHAPSPLSEKFQYMLEMQFEKRGFRVVPFSEVLDPQNAHEILVFNVFYSDGYETEQLAENEAKFLLLRLLASTIPEDLNVEDKKNIVFIEALTRYHKSDSWLSVIEASLEESVTHVGENGKGIKKILLK